MIKIIEKSVAGKYYCPVATERNERCHGECCMKWEDETVIENRCVEEVVTRDRVSHVVASMRDVKVSTGRGWCGL